MTEASPANLTNRQSWKALGTHYEIIRNVHLRTLFAGDPQRGERLLLKLPDYSSTTPKPNHRRNRCAPLPIGGGVRPRSRIEAMFGGDKINVTEDRAVLHVALRMPRSKSIVLDGRDVVADVHAVLDKMADFSERVRSGAWKGHTGKRIRNVINIGIGGSDLGPVMAYEALKYYATRSINFRFVSNIDSTDIVEALRDLDPADTLHRLIEDLHYARNNDERKLGS